VKRAAFVNADAIVALCPGLFRKKRKARLSAGFRQTSPIEKSGAGEGIRTLDPDLGKVVLYH
jgi:hypothetical protein